LQRARSVLAVDLVERAMKQLPVRQRSALIQGIQALLNTDPQRRDEKA
jgi:hypothetical protein